MSPAGRLALRQHLMLCEGWGELLAAWGKAKAAEVLNEFLAAEPWPLKFSWGRVAKGWG